MAKKNKKKKLMFYKSVEEYQASMFEFDGIMFDKPTQVIMGKYALKEIQKFYGKAQIEEWCLISRKNKTKLVVHKLDGQHMGVSAGDYGFSLPCVFDATFVDNAEFEEVLTEVLEERCKKKKDVKDILTMWKLIKDYENVKKTFE